MRAKFVNEKFEEGSDPIADMGIGLSFLNLKPSLGFQQFLKTRVIKT